MKPSLPGYNVESFLGEGVCGQVWVAEDPVGNRVAIRSLNYLAINLNLLKETERRLDLNRNQEGGTGAMPIWLKAYDLKPSLQVCPLLADKLGGEWHPRTLLSRLGEQGVLSDQDEAERLVRELAGALARMHRCQAVHGNLKPGNIFFDDAGELVLADYAMGWMPKVELLSFSDSILYMAPEQIEDPGGHYREEGYRWDVYAFGVLAYRILEGAFPRCDEFFREVASSLGSQMLGEFDVDTDVVVEDVRKAEMRPWQRCQNLQLREMVEKCLALAPQERFRDMVEAEQWQNQQLLSFRYHKEMQLVGRKLRHGRQLRRVLAWGMAASITLGLVGSALLYLQRDWDSSSMALENEEAREKAELAEQSARELRDDAMISQARTEAELTSARDEIDYLSKSHAMLFDWAISETTGEFPILFGREARLSELEKHFQNLARYESNGTEEWKQVWEAKRAQIAIAKGQFSEARRLIGNDLSQLGGEGLTRMLLAESEMREVKREDLALAQNLVARSSVALRSWLETALSLIEIRNLERHGQKDRALRQLVELEKNVEATPSSASHASLLWRVRLREEAATIADGAGHEKVALLMREELFKNLRSQARRQDLDEVTQQLIFERILVASEGLSESYYALGRLADAEAIAKNALTYSIKEPSERVKIARAMQYVVLAGCERERGETVSAEKLMKQALSMIVKRSEQPGVERWRRYREGMVKWQLAAIYSQKEEFSEERRLGEEAAFTMRELLDGDGLRPSAIQVHHVLGYLCGDLAKCYEQGGELKKREQLLDEAIDSWRYLKTSNPLASEYEAGLTWVEKLKSAN